MLVTLNLLILAVALWGANHAREARITADKLDRQVNGHLALIEKMSGLRHRDAMEGIEKCRRAVWHAHKSQAARDARQHANKGDT